MPFEYLSSHVNPNLSSTNLTNVGAYRQPLLAPPPAAGRVAQPKPARLSLQHSSPSFPSFSHFQPPITPPISASGTPVRERDAYPVPQAILNQGADQLKTITMHSSWLPPINLKVCLLCLAWYVCLAVSNNSTKSILRQFTYLVTMTEVQFLLNCIFSVALLALMIRWPQTTRLFPRGFTPELGGTHRGAPRLTLARFLTPTRPVITTTLPMGMFQFVGHLTSHKATSLIPVSLVSTVKAMAPLTTVLSYRVLYLVKYRPVTYITLVPLVVGIMMACYKPKHNLQRAIMPHYKAGLFFSFVSMLIFVSQNIFAKKILTVIESKPDLPLLAGKAAPAPRKHDKLTILYYCSFIGFLLTLPFYLALEWQNYRAGGTSLWFISPQILLLMVMNGLAHFLQSMLAFQILGSILPVNYSIANIMKRIIVIVVAILWEGQTVSQVQGYGLGLTMVGLYCYDRWGTKHA